MELKELNLEHFINPEDPNDTLFYHSSFWKDSNAKTDENNQKCIGDDKKTKKFKNRFF